MAEPTQVPFGSYQPDLPPILNDGLTVARNTVPAPGGYRPVRALAAVSGFTALAERVKGAIAGIDPAGNPWNFAGTETKLYALRADTQDVTRLSGPYNCTVGQTWEFIAFENYIIAVDGFDDTQVFDLNLSSNFTALGNATTQAPKASHVGVIGSFVMLGNTFDLVNGEGRTAIHWSALNDPFNWPTPGTDVARAVQSDRQVLAGDGGEVQRVVSGAEVGAIFQERAIWRADYRGGDVVFELSRVEPNRGLLVPQIAVPFGRQVFYLAEDGFYLFDYTQSIPIGDNVVDSTFLADLDTEHYHRVSAVKDPDARRIWILYPGSGNSNGTPNRYLVYDWVLNRFSHGDLTAEWLTQASPLGLTLDSPHTADDPDTDGVDGAGLPSFDDRIAHPGALHLGAYSTANALSAFTGAIQPAVLETGRRALRPSMRSLVNAAEVIVDNVNPTIQCAGLSKANGTLNYGQPSRVNEDGISPLRCDARYHAFRVSLPTGWNNALGLHVWSAASGNR